MRILILCLLFQLLLTCPGLYAQATLSDTIVYGGDSNFPPFEFIDNMGNPAGFNVDLIRAIATEMGFPVKVKLEVWSGIRNEFENIGTVHITDMYYSKQREDIVEYANSHEVNYDELYIQKGNQDIKSFDDLKGKKLAVQERSTIEEHLKLNNPEIILISVPSEPDALRLLASGGCDAAMVSRIIAYETISNLEMKNLITVGQPFMPRTLSFVVLKGNKQLLELINIGLFRMKESGKFTELQKKWISNNRESELTKRMIVSGVILIASFMLAFLWITSLRYTVKSKTAELEFSNSRLRLISNVKAARIDKLSTKEQSVKLLKQVQETFNADACVIRILEKDEMKLLACIGIAPGILPESVTEGFDFFDHNFKGNTEKESAQKNHTEKCIFRNELADYNYHSFACTPLISEDRMTGVLCIYSKNEQLDFFDFDREHLQIVANQIGISIENNRLFDQNEKQKEIMVRQIMANKKAKDEIQQLNTELEQRVAARTAELQAVNKELETFTYSVSHDLKAPLRGIDGFSKLLVDLYDSELNDEARHFLQIIRKSTKQMSQLIDELLDYSRMERSLIRNEVIQILRLVDSIISQFSSELETEKIDVIIHVPDVVLHADVNGLTIALRNLIGNAIKFSKGKENPRIELNLKENESGWILSVKDNGIGFDMKYHQRIYNIFQRLHRVEDYPGTGIGLAMVSKTMQRMNGKVWAESKPNEGSIFFLEIPKTL